MNEPEPKNEQLSLGLLDAIKQRGDMSRRDLVAKLVIALDLTNSYLKRCARKSFVTVKAVSAKRYIYAVRPKGFTEKSRLTARFLSTSVPFSRQSIESCSEVLEVRRQAHRHRTVLRSIFDLSGNAYEVDRYTGQRRLRPRSIPAGPRASLDARMEGWPSVQAADAYMGTDVGDRLEMYREVNPRINNWDGCWCRVSWA